MISKWPLVLFALLSLPLPAQGQTPEAAQKRLEALKLPFSEEAFIQQIRKGDGETVGLYLEAGMNPNAKDASGRPALVWAAGNGHAEVVKRLLQEGAELCA